MSKTTSGALYVLGALVVFVAAIFALKRFNVLAQGGSLGDVTVDTITINEQVLFSNGAVIQSGPTDILVVYNGLACKGPIITEGGIQLAQDDALSPWSDCYNIRGYVPSDDVEPVTPTGYILLELSGETYRLPVVEGEGQTIRDLGPRRTH
jgi:hypothetical protein